MWELDELEQLLAGRLSRAERTGRLLLSPAMAYGRHRGPHASGSRHAAVAVSLCRDPDGGWTIPLTLRPVTLRHHGGQISFPGGRIEDGETAEQAAAREFEEELGVEAEAVRCCGRMSTQYVYASDNLVHPVVWVRQRPQQPWNPDRLEVAKVIELPLTALRDPGNRVELTRSRHVRCQGQTVGSLRFRTLAIRQADHDIWGATAMILEELARILHTDSGECG